MPPRPLSFKDAEEAIAEAERLLRAGYERGGTWDLAQVCDHVTFFAKGPIEGWSFKVPWLLKALFGKLALRRILKSRSMGKRVPTPQKPLPAPGGDERAAVGRFREALLRLESHAGPFHPSPFFGELTPAEWRELNLIHAAHHLGYLIPKSEG
ncbi:MAG TPA: DUF1569 domain-containing protein [Planctomycetia bacterium]|nr:DUF1569 domain-containing protein [Planctomycetia bacterium]